MTRATVLPVLLTVCAVAVRLCNLAQASFRLDESYDTWIATIPVHSLGVALQVDAHPPVYYLLLHVWIQLWHDTGEAVMRSFSVVVGAVTCFLVWRWADQAAGRRAAVMCLSFYVVSALAVEMDRYTKSYCLVTCLVAGSTVLLLRACKTNAWRDWIFYAAAMLALIYTHYFGFLIGAAHAISIPSQDRRRFLTCAVFDVVCFLPWVPMWHEQSLKSTASLLLAPSWGNLASLLSALVGAAAFHSPPLTVKVVLAIVVVLLVAAGASHRDLASRIAFRMAAVVLIAFIGVSLTSTFHFFIYRYISIILAPFAVLFGTLFERLSQAQVKVAWCKVMLCILASILVVNMAGTVALLTDPSFSDENWRYATHRVLAEKEPGDVVVLVPSCTLFPFNYYYGGLHHMAWDATQNQLSLVPSDGFVQYPLDSLDMSVLQAATQARGTVWLVTEPLDPIVPDIVHFLLRTRKYAGGFDVAGRFSTQSISVGAFRRLTP